MQDFESPRDQHLKPKQGATTTRFKQIVADKFHKQAYGTIPVSRRKNNSASLPKIKGIDNYSDY